MTGTEIQIAIQYMRATGYDVEAAGLRTWNLIDRQYGWTVAHIDRRAMTIDLIDTNDILITLAMQLKDLGFRRNG